MGGSAQLWAMGLNSPVGADVRLLERANPDFPYATPEMTACAAFIKESRIEVSRSHKVRGKPGAGKAHNKAMSGRPNGR
jgi:hypothetical protein